MDYIKKIFNDENYMYVSFPSTDDNIICKGGKTLREEFKDIANLSLVKHTDGKVYIKKQDGTLIGTGVEVSSGADLSKVTMTMSGQTLKLLNKALVHKLMILRIIHL